MLRAGEEVEATICAAVADAGCDGAWVNMGGLYCDPFRFVMPGPSPDGTRVAWYSDTFEPKGEVHVDMGGMSAGHHKGGNFTHCHGIWTSSEGTTLGHMLAPRCTASRDVKLKATGFVGARFERLADAETCFDLFRVCPLQSDTKEPDGILLTLRPNTDLCATLEDIASAHGISEARIMGLGSINGARFIDAAPMQSAITEFIISDGVLAGGKAQIELSAVDICGDIYDGTVLRDGASISITAELLLRRT
jgi:predicted DNA-binding protein with PD1-like motif